AEFSSESVWEAEGRPLLRDRRAFRFFKLPGGEVLVRISLALKPSRGGVRLGRTNFGLLSVRVAKPMSVLDGDGEILDSEGRRNERGILGKRARWCAYIGTPSGGGREAVAILDSPRNPRHPTYWHVRDDGWMCASFTMRAGLDLRDELELTYWLYLARATAAANRIESLYRALFEGFEAEVKGG
ncbi:MAG TPA: hypothetical protein EYP65_02645, partial [Armatimonadetes bacterium]|nr:hypothetical protein [Armatimonadota bacterium]